jgi:dTDP-4-dehydrorhamnose reductase
MKILLIGANSYVGARLYFDLRSSYSIAGTYATHPLSKDFIHLDITNKSEVDDVIKKTKPDIIIHSANNASATWCDANPEKAIALNQTSTQTIAEVSKKYNSKIIYISSMSVFDQSNMYGKTKLASEKIIQNLLNEKLINSPLDNV